MDDDRVALIKAAVSATLREVAEWGLAFQSTLDEPAREELRGVADRVDALDRDDTICPVCEEATCDEGCPLEEVRRR